MTRATSTGPPVGDSPGKKEKIESMFDEIASRYDLLNRVLSGGIDRIWRRRTIDELAPYAPTDILDVATGTADLAIEASRLNAGRIVGVDIAEEMLAIGRKKITGAGLSGVIELIPADAENLPFPDQSFEAVTVAFGVRNFEELGRGLSEIRRVLKPGGVAVILEFSKPRVFPIRQLYDLYGRFILPGIGRIVSGSRQAYRYLPTSIAAFPDGDDFIGRLLDAGFDSASERRQTFGIATIYTAQVIGSTSDT